VPRGVVVNHEEQVRAAVEQLGFPWSSRRRFTRWRGKGGGVKLARSLDEAIEITRHIIGMKLLTHQTGPKPRGSYRFDRGSSKIKQEFYLACIGSRNLAAVFMASSAAHGDRRGRRE